jgi:hypothetical protein
VVTVYKTTVNGCVACFVCFGDDVAWESGLSKGIGSWHRRASHASPRPPQKACLVPRKPLFLARHCHNFQHSDRSPTHLQSIDARYPVQEIMDSAIEQPDPSKILDLSNIRFQLMYAYSATPAAI